MKKLYVEVDTNDGDYVSKFEEISDEELEILTPLINAIKNCKKSHNFPTGDQDDGTVGNLYSEFEGLNLFEECFIPYPEYGFHTIETIEVYEITNIQKLI